MKICGMTSLEDALFTAHAGADAIGFILYDKSKRYIEPQKAVEIACQLPPFIQRVAVTVNMDIDAILQLSLSGAFDLWQLHGDESPEFSHQLRAQGLRTIRALGLPLEDAFATRLSDFDVDGFLLDKSSEHYGGTGETFDWKLAQQFMDKVVKLNKPCILAGGLSPENVVQAIAAVQPYAVDVCSGVEKEYGVKDHQKIEEFIKLCRQR